MMRDNHGALRTSSADPNEAMVASQQKHIADLVARNKTLEHTSTRLRATVAIAEGEYAFSWERGVCLLSCTFALERLGRVVSNLGKRWCIDYVY